MELPSFSNWNYLPNEIKTNVIQKMDNNSRLALRECSSNSQKLVDLIRYRKICKLNLFNDENLWCISILRTTYGNHKVMKFPSFDEFQIQLTKEIENSDYIQEMRISNTEVGNTLSLLRFGKLVKIKTLFIFENGTNSRDIIEQIQPNYLKKLGFLRNTFEPEILDMPQVTYKDLSILDINHIRDDQLITFEGSDLYLRNCRMLTAIGINNFIRKCLSNLDKNHVTFRILYREEHNIAFQVIEGLDIASSEEDRKVMINSPFPNLQLEIEYSDGFVAGRTIGNSQNSFEKEKRQNDFEAVESMQIEYSGTKRGLTIGYKNRGQLFYEFDSINDLQRKLTEELGHINYIKDLKIYDATHEWNLTSSMKNKIAVGMLTLCGGNNDIGYLRQIEPIHLKEIVIDGLAESEVIYDMPQVIHAEKLTTSHSRIRDDQLLKMKTIRLELQTENSENHCNLTDSGINSFVKKRLLELNQHDFYFSFFNSGNDRDVSKFFEGLDISSQKQISEFEKETIVNSPFPEYQLELRTGIGSFTGRRIEKV